MPHFDALNIYSYMEKIVRKGEIACNKRFFLISQYPLPLFFILNALYNVVCSLFQFGPV